MSAECIQCCIWIKFWCGVEDVTSCELRDVWHWLEQLSETTADWHTIWWKRYFDYVGWYCLPSAGSTICWLNAITQRRIEWRYDLLDICILVSVIFTFSFLKIHSFFRTEMCHYLMTVSVLKVYFSTVTFIH